MTDESTQYNEALEKWHVEHEREKAIWEADHARFERNAERLEKLMDRLESFLNTAQER